MKLLGALAFPGGYRSMTVEMPTATVRQIKFEIPSLCQGVQVEAAGTISDGLYFAAKKVGNTYFSDIAGGVNVTSIRAIVSGPEGRSCFISVYSSEK